MAQQVTYHTKKPPQPADAQACYDVKAPKKPVSYPLKNSLLGGKGRRVMIHEEVLAEISQLIQDYFVWAVTNPEQAATLSLVPSPFQQQTSKNKQPQVEHSDLLGFSRWLAQGRK